MSFTIRKFLFLATMLGLLAGCTTSKQDLYFRHDTLALTWQPGFCGVDGGCRDDQPRDVLIGLHGLWASEPWILEARNIPVQQWWQQGCALLSAEKPETPILGAALDNDLIHYMPHTKEPLVSHEWNKHARCFHYNAGEFFEKALALRRDFAASTTAVWLIAHQGQLVARATLLQHFQQENHAVVERALQLRCEDMLTVQGQERVKHPVLTQFWFTLRHDRLAVFPRAEAFVYAPYQQDNCPARFWVPSWEK